MTMSSTSVSSQPAARRALMSSSVIMAGVRVNFSVYSSMARSPSVRSAFRQSF